MQHDWFNANLTSYPQETRSSPPIKYICLTNSPITFDLISLLLSVAQIIIFIASISNWAEE